MNRRPTSIAIAVVQRDGQFLVGQRGPDVPLAGLWEFPGGKAEPGESAEDAARRECLEETGLEVRVVRPYPVCVEQYDHDQVQLAFFACEPIGEPVKPRPPFRWVPRVALKQLAFPTGNRHLLSLLLEDGPS